MTLRLRGTFFAALMICATNALAAPTPVTPGENTVISLADKPNAIQYDVLASTLYAVYATSNSLKFGSLDPLTGTFKEIPMSGDPFSFPLAGSNQTAIDSLHSYLFLSRQALNTIVVNTSTASVHSNPIPSPLRHSTRDMTPFRDKWWRPPRVVW